MADRLAHRVSAALLVVAGVTAFVSFAFWGVFHDDVPSGVGNLRGTALTLGVLVLPAMAVAMRMAGRGSLRAWLIWFACLLYLAYNAVMFCFAAHFNAYFLLYTTMLALSFWSLVTLLRATPLEAVDRASARVPARAVAAYLVVSLVFFAALWLQAIVPAMLTASMPPAIVEMGLTQNPVWVLDFAFTFPLMALGAAWLWQRRPWGIVIGGGMTIMLAFETAGIAIDQYFGHLHDPSAPLDAVPVLAVFTVVGATASALFLRGVVPGNAPRSAL